MVTGSRFGQPWPQTIYRSCITNLIILPRQWLAKQTGFRARANAAQANLFESLPFFFAAVIIASMANAPQGRVDLLAIEFVAARIAYLVCYVADWPTTRSVMWLAGIACVVSIFFQI